MSELSWAVTMWVLRLGPVGGPKAKANASKHKAVSREYPHRPEEQLRRKVQELLRCDEQADAENEPEMDIPDELVRREGRLATIEEAKAEIERRARGFWGRTDRVQGEAQTARGERDADREEGRLP